MPNRNEYPASSALAESLIEHWNSRDLEGLLSSYHPNVEFVSPAILEAYQYTDGAIGSPDGVIRGTEALREYFNHAIRNVPELELTLLHITRGLNGTVAVTYGRENGTVATELMRLEQGRVVKAEVLYSPGPM